MFDFINKPLGFVLEKLAVLFGGNFAFAVAAFTLLINIILLPLSIKSQKASVQQTRIKPKLDDLRKRYGDDKVKYNEAMQKLYQEENVKMSGGCLPMLIRLGLMLSIYTLILSPLTYMSGANENQIKNVTTVVSNYMNDLDEDEYDQVNKLIHWRKGASNELSIVRIIRSDEDVLKEVLPEKQYNKIKDDLADIKAKDQENHIDYNFFSSKIDLTETPDFSWNIFKEAQIIWIMPIIAFLSQILSSLLSMAMQKKINPEAPSMAGMMIMMPLISLFIGFSLPGGVTFYWACSSLIGGLIQVGVQNFYGPYKMLARERSKDLTKQCAFEEGQIKKLAVSDSDK